MPAAALKGTGQRTARGVEDDLSQALLVVRKVGAGRPFLLEDDVAQVVDLSGGKTVPPSE
ncbi:MAG: hypothetical protein HY690_03650 [Chloroflexi bacterium]|nr:hypothetical protein [Chloroflexota bacterium]